MRRAAIVNPVRTPVGAFGGALRAVPVETLGGIVAKETVKRSGVDPKLVEDVVFGQSYANSETPCVGRWIALDAGFPIEVPGLQTDRRCGGGLQALVTAAMMVRAPATSCSRAASRACRTSNITRPTCAGGDGREQPSSTIGWTGGANDLSPYIALATSPG